MDRRTVLGLGGAALAGLTSRSAGQQAGLTIDSSEVIPLWSDSQILPERYYQTLEPKLVDRGTAASNGRDRYVSGVLRPTLTVFRPSNPDGSAIVVIPGGDYTEIALDREGFEVARWLNTFGITSFVLTYRLPLEGWWSGSDVPLRDAQRAIRVLRANPARYNIDSKRLGVMGFSSGAHLAGCLLTLPYLELYPPVDAIDELDSKPDFGGLIYPVISMASWQNLSACKALLGEPPNPQLVGQYSVDDQIGRHTPPLFILLAADDKVVMPIANGIAAADRMVQFDRPIELHVLQDGGHGFGLRFAKSSAAAAWPNLFLRWGNRNSWFHRSPTQE